VEGEAGRCEWSSRPEVSGYGARVRRALVLILVCALVAAVAATAAAREPTLRVVFPEGMSVRQMTDRVAAVRRIAIAKRRITPRLDGRS
jgi:hypothetical protein